MDVWNFMQSISRSPGTGRGIASWRFLSVEIPRDAELVQLLRRHFGALLRCFVAQVIRPCWSVATGELIRAT
jgi:hypothetical protein